MRAVNLLPRDMQQRKSFREEDPAVVVGSALGVIVMIALGAAFFVAHGKANTQQARLTKAQLELAALSEKKREAQKPAKPSAPITPIVPPPAITGQEASWLSAVSTNLSQRIAFDRVLRDVSLVIPDDITLSSMTMSAPLSTVAVPGVPPPTASQGFVIAGTAYSYDSVARLLSRLALVPDLNTVTLTSTGSGAAAGLDRQRRRRRAVQHQRGDQGRARAACSRRDSSGPGRHDDGEQLMRGKKISRRGAVIMIVGGDLLLLVLGWFMLVSPQRATAQSIARSAQATEVQVEQASSPASNIVHPVTQPKQPEIRTAYLYKLSKAMPMTPDMPNLLLELSQTVRASGVELSSISPTPTDATTGITSITLTVKGDFYSLTDLLYRLRSLVAVRDGALDVSGRLFAVKSVGFTPDGQGTSSMPTFS